MIMNEVGKSFSISQLILLEIPNKMEVKFEMLARSLKEEGKTYSFTSDDVVSRIQYTEVASCTSSRY